MLHTSVVRKGTAGLAMVASVLALAGCGAASRVGAQNATAVECGYTMPTQSTTVNVLAYNSSAIDPFTNTMVKSCSRDRVTLKHDPIDFAGQVTKTTETLAGDEGSYDILETYGFVLPGLADNGKLEPLDDLVAKYSDRYKLNELNAAMREGLSFDGKLYALPMQAQMFVLAYRTDVFDSLGLKPPTNFAEMIESAKAIQTIGGIRYPIALPWLATADVTTHYQAAMNSLGKDFIDPSGRVQFDSDEASRALEGMRSLFPYMDPQVTTFDQPKVQQQMFNGTAAMGIMFSGRMNDLTLPANSKLSGQFGFAASPAIEAGAPYLYSRLSIDGWSIPKNTTLDKDMLFQMMAASISEEASKAAVPAAYPAREDTVSPDSSKYATAAIDTIAKTMPAIGQSEMAAVSNAIRPVLVQIITGQVEVPVGLIQMQDLAERAISGRR